jgi:hypothetical protein
MDTHTYAHTSSTQALNTRNSVTICNVLTQMNGNIKLQNEIRNFHSIFRIIIEYCYQSAIWQDFIVIELSSFGSMS